MKNLTPAELAVVARVDRDRVADDLAALVAIPSLTGDESEVQTEVALRMTTAGLDVERVDTPAIELAADPDFPGVEVARDSHPVVTGRVTGDAAGRRVLIAGHIDVVGAGDEMAWTSPPFQPRIDDGVLYGRGACDMKAGVVAGLAALRAIVEAEVDLGGEAMLVSVPGEEDGGAGMLAAIRAGCTGDWAVITEPTRLEIVTEHHSECRVAVKANLPCRRDEARRPELSPPWLAIVNQNVHVDVFRTFGKQPKRKHRTAVGDIDAQLSRAGDVEAAVVLVGGRRAGAQHPST